MTIGYQNDVSDDFEDIIKSNSYYLSGWIKPRTCLEIRSEYGFRAEKVDEGSRLLGDEDRNRFMISAKCKKLQCGSGRLKYEIKQRKNN